MTYIINKYLEFTEKRPELAFVVKVLVAASLVYSLRHFLYYNWMIFLFFFGFYPIVTLKLIALNEDKTFFEVLRQNLTFISVPHSEEERDKSNIPVVTYTLIFINVFIFYTIEPFITREVARQIVSVPISPTWYNVLPSMFISMFLHANSSHLWGNMLFLWAFGTTVERRIGPLHFISLYLCAGFFGDMLSIGIHSLTEYRLPRAIGASGAISGLLGLYAIRCYFKTMILPFPLFGLFSYVMPISVFIKIRINALFVIGMYFLRDAHGGMRDLAGIGFSRVAYWNHLGGFLSAVILGLLFKYHHDALLEKDTEFAFKSFEKSEMGTEEGEAALIRHIERNPDDEQALLILARMLSKYRQNSEGQSAYENAIKASLKKNATEALNIFKEYYDLYLKPLDSRLQYRMAALASKSGDLHFATRCLEPIIECTHTPVDLKRSCISHYSKLCNKLGMPEAARRYDEI